VETLNSLVFSNLSNLMFFRVNIAVCVAWYSLKYNPEESENPGWTWDLWLSDRRCRLCI
jgi:hypothetical protein